MTAYSTIVPPDGWVTRRYYTIGDNSIGWCGETANLFRGCTHVPGRRACDHCYAALLALMQEGNSRSPFARLKLAIVGADGLPQWTGKIAPASLEKWTWMFRASTNSTRALVFANSMSDLFHESLSDELILHWLRTVYLSPWHVFQVLTKRHGVMARIMSRLYEQDGMLHLADAPLPADQQALVPNLWLGVTAEDQRNADLGIPFLLRVKAGVRFLSMEPLMEAVNIRPYLHGIDWVIVGGESGKGWRPMDIDWARDLRDQCIGAGVPFFFKQESGLDPELLPELDGVSWPFLPRRDLMPIAGKMERHRLLAWSESEYRRIVQPGQPDPAAEAVAAS